VYTQEHVLESSSKLQIVLQIIRILVQKMFPQLPAFQRAQLATIFFLTAVKHRLRMLQTWILLI